MGLTQPDPAMLGLHPSLREAPQPCPLQPPTQASQTQLPSSWDTQGQVSALPAQ